MKRESARVSAWLYARALARKHEAILSGRRVPRACGSASRRVAAGNAVRERAARSGHRERERNRARAREHVPVSSAFARAWVYLVFPTDACCKVVTAMRRPEL